jgi:membrane protease subunit HflC
MAMHLFAFSSDDENAATAKTWWGLGLLVLVVVVTAILFRTVFFVDETEYVYVAQFGKPLRLYTQAGLGVKWPYQSLRRFDRRLQTYEPPPREILTKDKENLNFAWFVCWRIPSREFIASRLGLVVEEERSTTEAQEIEADLKKHVERFLQSVGSVQAAESRLEERIQAALAAEIGRTDFSQLVSLEPGRVEIEDLTARVAEAVRDAAAEQFGIEVVDVRLKRFNYPEAVKPAVYAEIRSERERVAVQYRAEGASEKTKIESLATLQRDQLLAEARREAASIRGQAEAKAIEISNAAHSKDPEFYELLKTLETYESILDDQTTVVLSADSPLLKLLTRGLPEWKETPDEKPASPGASPPLTSAPGGDVNAAPADSGR